LPNFYYTAVSTAQHKISGIIEAKTENKARYDLNRMKLSVLTISSKKPAEWKNQDLNFFEFGACDKSHNKIIGTIEAKDKIAALDRLDKELEFSVEYICATDISDIEKAQARKEGIEPILQAKAAREKAAASEKKSAFGGLEALMKKSFGDSKKNRTEATDLQKSEAEIEKHNLKNEDFTKKSMADLELQSNAKKVAQVKIGQVAIEENNKKEKKDKIHKINLNSTDNIQQNSASGVSTHESKNQELSNTPIFLPKISWKEKFSQFYFLVKKLIKPSAEENRMDLLREIKKLFFVPATNSSNSNAEKEITGVMLRKAIFERFWLEIERLALALAVVFAFYLLLGELALHFELGKFSSLAEKTLTENLLIVFLTLIFVVMRILLWLREKVTSWSPARTLFLFLVGGAGLIVVGVNLL
jgi:hypothetical protein